MAIRTVRLTALAQRLLAERYAPASVIINRKCEILYLCGPTDDYLAQPPGRLALDLVAKAREGLRTTLRAAVHKAAREEQPVTVRARVKRQNTFRRVKVTVEPLKTANEMEGLLLVSFAEDPEEPGRSVAPTHTPSGSVGCDESLVTQRVRGEKALRATNEALRGDALFEGAPTGIAMIDSSGRVLSVNAQMEKMFGYKREELIGRSVETLVPEQFRPSHVTDRVAYAANPRGRAMGRGRDLSAVRKDGTEFPVEIGLNPVHTGEGLLIAAYVSDISARKQAEAALRQAHGELEQRVLERTAELRGINDRLSELSNRLLTLQDEERRRIGRDLHDSTAQSLVGAAMKLTALQQAAQRLPVPARKALADSIALVDQCLSEIRTVSYLLHPPLLDEVGLVSAVTWYADGFAKRSGITVDVKAPPELGRLRQEAEMALFRVVQEALTNVHRHSGSSSVGIQIDRAADSVTVKVQDNGRGIAPEVLKAFADGDVRIGVGILGMRERMRQLGGLLAITSTANGSIVEATLPLGAPPDASDSTKADV